MLLLHKKSFLGIGLAALVVVGMIVGIGASRFHRSRSNGHAAAAQDSSPEEEPQDDDNPQESIVTVKIVRPTHNESFNTSVEQPAYVAAYYQADLRARVAGPFIPAEGMTIRDIGDRVKAGDPLVTIDVPDLKADEKQKEALVEQQEREVELANARVKIAAAAVQEATEIVALKKHDVERAEATRLFREKELARFKVLASGPSPGVTPDIVDERTMYKEAAVADSLTAQAAVKQAEAQLAEAKVKLEAAQVDVKRQEAMVKVAKEDLGKARALLGFATLKAPFDGVITNRNVDPGSFVQNASTGQTEPLFTIARTDIVTVYMKVPDNYAPFVKPDCDAIIQMNSLPGIVIRGKVTRRSESLVTPEHDRTMRVEVDLYNGSVEDYKDFLAKEKESRNADLKSHKLPMFPSVLGKQVSAEPLGLLPGQYGKMRLILRGFRKAYFLPRSAVISHGGASFVYLVKDGHAVKVPVEVQADNGKMVKVVLVEKIGEEEVKRELTEDDEVIVSNQGELTNGQAVKTAPVDQ
jgi:multidrug resistance efflux pump